MTMPLPAPLLTVPYVSLAEFKANPTWIETDDLIEGGIQSQQDYELYNQLLKASAWADDWRFQPFRAHYQVENLECRVDPRGRIFIHPSHNPVKSVAAVSYGNDLTDMQQVQNLSSSVWIQDQNGIIVALSGLNARWAGSLQFGSAPASPTQVYVQVEYVAGFGHSVLLDASTASAGSLTVDSVLGWVPPSTSLAGNAYGASVGRIWDPQNPENSTGPEEAATIASVNASSGTLSFASNLTYAHAAQCNISELPADVKQAIVQYTVGLILRQDVTDDLPWSGSSGPASNRSAALGHAGGLINEAEKVICKYRRTR